MRVRLAVVLALVPFIGVAGGMFVGAQSESVGTVEIRVWEQVDDPTVTYISARPAGESWHPFGTVRLELDDGFSRDQRFRYGDFSVATQSKSVPTVEIRVWEQVDDPTVTYISARPAGGSWRPFGTVRLELDDGFSRDRRFRYGDFSVEGTGPVPAPTPTPTPTASPTPDPVTPESTSDPADTSNAVAEVEDDAGGDRDDDDRGDDGDTDTDECSPPDEVIQQRLATLRAQQAIDRQALLESQAEALQALREGGGSAEQIAALRRSHQQALTTFNVNANLDLILASVQRC